MMPSTVRFIGDIHGTFNVRSYELLTEDVDKSIQIGDLGIGFQAGDDLRMFKNIDREKHFFIRGNHDHPELCESQINHIPSGQSDDHGIFFVNGGWSIDGPREPWCRSTKNPDMKPTRTEGKNWWAEEEHSPSHFDRLVEEYKDTKPDVMVTHEGPVSITKAMFRPYDEWNSRTAIALQKMLDFHKPDVWIFGHWHMRKDMVFSDKTRFICLEECGYIDLEL